MYKYKYSLFTVLSIKLSKYLNIRSHLFSAFLAFGLPFYLLFIFMLFLKREILDAQPLLFASMCIAGLWLWLGPVLIVNWELSFKKFQNSLCIRIKPAYKVKSTIANKIYLNDRFRLYTSLAFSGVMFFVVFSGIDVYKKVGLNHGYSDPVFWLSLFLSLYIGFTAGFGFWGVFKTIHSVFLLNKYYDLKWKIYSSDNYVGLAFMYKFVLATTFMFSGGTVMVPFWIEIAYQSNTMLQVLSIFLIILYSFSIAVSYIIPASVLQKNIKKKIEKKLDEISLSLNDGYHTLEKTDEFIKLHKTYQYLENYDLTPLDLKKVVKFGLSIVSPILLLFIKMLFGKFTHM